ncbi:peptide ABC transporter ATP-binding protein, partial [Listeria monocytogenes]|nr:peptide ABC transporter ATP-binding protein [Listeria monocytogenes]
APEVTPPDAVLRRQEKFAELHPGRQAVHAKGVAVE